MAALEVTARWGPDTSIDVTSRGVTVWTGGESAVLPFTEAIEKLEFILGAAKVVRAQREGGEANDLRRHYAGD